MNRLDIKHLAPYLPYNLKVTFDGDEFSHKLVELSVSHKGVGIISPDGDFGTAYYEDVRPILRPLTDLTKEIEHNGESFVPIEKLFPVETDFEKEIGISSEDYVGYILNDELNISYEIAVQLFEWHFDVFGLIDQGLAININDIEI